jgi:hypothetical protein
MKANAASLYFLGAKMSFKFLIVREYDDSVDFTFSLTAKMPFAVTEVLWTGDFHWLKCDVRNRIDELKQTYRDFYDFCQVVQVGDTYPAYNELDDNGLPNPTDTLIRYRYNGDYHNVLVSSDDPNYRVLTTVGAVVPFSWLENFAIMHDNAFDE